MVTDKLMIFTLLVLAGFYSCEKDEIKVEKQVKIEQNPLLNKDGGDDDDDPIVQGLVYRDSVLLENVITEIIPDTSQTPIGVTNLNGFQFRVPLGKYYLKVTPNHETSVFSEVFDVTGDVVMNVILE